MIMNEQGLNKSKSHLSCQIKKFESPTGAPTNLFCYALFQHLIRTTNTSERTKAHECSINERPCIVDQIVLECLGSQDHSFREFPSMNEQPPFVYPWLSFFTYHHYWPMLCQMYGHEQIFLVRDLLDKPPHDHFLRKRRLHEPVQGLGGGGQQLLCWGFHTHIHGA